MELFSARWEKKFARVSFQPLLERAKCCLARENWRFIARGRVLPPLLELLLSLPGSLSPPPNYPLPASARHHPASYPICCYHREGEEKAACPGPPIEPVVDLLHLVAVFSLPLPTPRAASGGDGQEAREAGPKARAQAPPVRRQSAAASSAPPHPQRWGMTGG